MYTNTSEEFGRLVTSNGRTWKARIIVGKDAVEDILSIEVNRGSATTDSIEIGTAVAGYVEIIAKSTLIFENKEIILEEGLVLSDGTTEYIPVGKFDVTKAVTKGERATISAADILATKAESIYVTTLTDTAEMVQEICTYLGISFEGELKGITIASPTGLTKRETLGYIAGLYGKFACINRKGNLVFKWYEDTYLISRDDVEEPDLSQNDFIVNKLVVNNGSTEYTTGTSGAAGIFSSNPLMTEDLIEGAYSGLAGFKYRPGTINLILGDPRLDPWDMISYEDYILICGKITDVYDGGVKTVINSPGKSESESESNYKGPTAKALERYYAELVLINEALIKKLDVEQLDAVRADIESAVIKELGTEFLTVTAADVKYADIKLANIDRADIGTFFFGCGLIDRADIVEGHVTGFLNSVEINADKITAGTLVADRILLNGNKKGILYALNNLGELTSEEVNTLDGYVLTDKTITADKIVAKSITANEIDVENLFAQDITASGIIRGATFVGGAISSDIWMVDPATSETTQGALFDLSTGWMYSPCVSWTDSAASIKNMYIEGFLRFDGKREIDGKDVNIIFQIDDNGLFIIPNLTSGINRSCRFDLDSLSIVDSDVDKSFEYSTEFGLIVNNVVDITGETTIKSTLRTEEYIYTSKYLSAAENIYSGSETRDANTYCGVRNKYRYGGVYVSTTGNLGLIDVTNNKYVIYQDSNGITRIPAKLLCSDSITASNIELTAATPFIDFHYDSSTADYTSRIREVAASIIQIQVDQLRVSSMTSGGVPIIRSSSGTLQVGASDNNSVMYISGSEVHVCNTARNAYKVIKASAFTVSSTRKLKDNILPMKDEEARKIYDLDVVSFDYKNGEKNQHGLIAEDVVNVIPSIVYGDINATDPDEIMKITLNYVGLIPYIIKEMQRHEKLMNKLLNLYERK